MRTANPAFNDDVFRGQPAFGATRATTMTIGGTVAKTGVLLALTVIAAAISWTHIAQNPQYLYHYWIGGMIGGLVFALITIFKPTAAPFTAPLYAVAEGLFLGGFSLFADQYAQRLAGAGTQIIPQAIALTFGTLGALLAAYSTRMIRATENFKLGVVAATGGIALVYLVTMVLGFFGVRIPYIHDSGIIGIGFSLFVVVVAALNLVLDFDFIEEGAKQGAPKHLEWYGGFALLQTLVWLYIEFVRLLLKLQQRD